MIVRTDNEKVEKLTDRNGVVKVLLRGAHLDGNRDCLSADATGFSRCYKSFERFRCIPARLLLHAPISLPGFLLHVVRLQLKNFGIPLPLAPFTNYLFAFAAPTPVTTEYTYSPA